MPEMDGLAFLEEAIKEGLVESIPVFLITASLEHDVVHRAYSLGVADYIQRPISPYIAQRRIENIIDLFKTRAAYKKLLEINRNLLERLSAVSYTHLRTAGFNGFVFSYRELGSHKDCSAVCTETRDIVDFWNHGAVPGTAFTRQCPFRFRCLPASFGLCLELWGPERSGLRIPG